MLSTEKQKNYAKKYYLKNKEKIKKQSAKRYNKNKEHINKRSREYRKSEHGRAILHAKKFHISYDEAKYWLGIKSCQICGDGLAVATDHCHKTGKVRGRLCHNCNRAMGQFRDSVNLLEKAIAYLRYSKGKEKK